MYIGKSSEIDNSLCIFYEIAAKKYFFTVVRRVFYLTFYYAFVIIVTMLIADVLQERSKRND